MIIELVNPVIVYPTCIKCGRKQDCFNCELHKKNLCSSPRGLCTKPYKNHPKGCPNYNYKLGCPPNCLMFDEVFDVNENIYAIITPFDMKSHIQKTKNLHPDWKDGMLRNIRYWQGTNRKEHKFSVKSFNEKYPEYYVTNGPENMGVDLISTLKQIGIYLKFPVEDTVYRVSLAGKLNKDAFQKFNLEVVEGTYKEKTLRSKLK